jgi:hypothetical protein
MSTTIISAKYTEGYRQCAYFERVPGGGHWGAGDGEPDSHGAVELAVGANRGCLGDEQIEVRDALLDMMRTTEVDCRVWTH